MSRRIDDDSRPQRTWPSRPSRLVLALGLVLPPLLALPLSASAQSGIVDIGALGGNYMSADGDPRASADGLVVVGNAHATSPRAFRWTSGGGKVDLGTLGGTFSSVRGISADGSVAVGSAYTAGNQGFHAVRWTGGGMVDLGTLGGSYSSAHGVSADGSVVVGSATAAGDGVSRAFRWTSAGGMVDLGTLGGPGASAAAVSADGLVVVGMSFTAGNAAYKVFRWTSGGGMVDLGNPAGLTFYAPTLVSANGSVVVYSSSATNHIDGARISRWTSGGGLVDLGTLGGTNAFANGISADGSVVVGWTRTGDAAIRAFRWTGGGGMVDLGTLGGTYSAANAVSADGSVVVGRATTTGGAVYRAFRWTQATGMQSVEDWLRAAGVTVPTDITASASATSSDGSVVVGNLANGDHPFIARIARAGSGLVTLADVQTSLGAASTGGNMTLSVAGTVLNGAHSRPLSRRVEGGRNAFWLAGDWGRDDHSARSGDMGLAEFGLGYHLGPAQLNVSLGQTWAKQSLLLNGRAKSDGSYLLAEALLPVAVNLWATVGGYRHWGNADLRRGYMNVGVQDASTGKPGVDTWGLRARLDWDAAYRVASADFSPYVDLSYSEAKLDAYTETGGGFPARFDARRDKATELRVGVNALRPLDNGLRLVGTLEAAHRMEHSGARTVGEVIGLFGFDLAGAANQRDWLRVGAGVEGKLAEGTASLSLNLTSKGEAPSAWLAANWQTAF